MNKFFVYKSSAGSGKTFTLVKEYLKWCFKSWASNYYSRILAITFTNKATYEMKERIIETLLNASSGDDLNDLNKLIISELNISETSLRNQSQETLAQILHNYGDFSISTIDKFSHKMIRTFAHDLNVPMNFKVELDLKEVLQIVVDELIRSVGNNNKYDSWIYDYTLSKLEENRSWKIDGDLINLYESLLEEKNRKYLNALKNSIGEDYSQLFEIYRNENLQFTNRISGIAEKAIQLIDSRGIKAENFYQARSGVYVYFKKKLEKNSFLEGPNSYVLDSFENDKWVVKDNIGSDIETAILDISDELKSYYSQIQREIEEGKSDYIIKSLLIKHLYSIAIQQYLVSQMERLKKEKSFINMGDVNHKIAEVVLSEPMPFIYERLGEKYQHIMIDEFQDTSPLQFANLLPLIDEALSKGFESLIVGDAKQAIYRFRGGDYKQLSQMPFLNFDSIENPELIEERLQSLQLNYQEKNLNHNFRSKQKIVEFNNSFFDFVKSSSLLTEEIQEIYKESYQESKDSSSKGFVQLKGVNESKIENEVLFKQLITDIQSCLNDGYKLSDIAILTHKNKQSTEIADFLSEHKIKVISSEALLLSNSKVIEFILDLLNVINKADNKAAFLGVANYLSDLKNIQLLDFYNNYNSISKLNEYLKSHYNLDIENSKGLPLIHLVEEIVRCFALAKDFDPYVQFFLDVVYDYSKSDSNSITEFNSYWEEKSSKYSIDNPEDINSINLMTIHRSKGLEFKVVMVPFSNASKSNAPDLVWIDSLPENKTKARIGAVDLKKDLMETNLSYLKEEEEQGEEADLINRMYVAYTRAAERLYIQFKSYESSSNSNSSTTLSADKLLRLFTEQNNELVKQSEYLFQFGSKADVENEISDEVKHFDFQYISNSLFEKLDFTSEGDSYNDELIQKGNIIHEIFQRMDIVDDLEKSIKEVKSLYFSYDSWVELSEELKRFVNLEEFQSLFNKRGRLYKEKEIVDNNGVLYRPDRVTEGNDFTIIMDFKTGKYNPNHEKQIKKYQDLVHSITNKKTNSYLVYTESLELRKIA